MGSRTRASQSFKYPDAAHRYLIMDAMGRLAQTTQHADPTVREDTFDQIYRHVESLARPHLGDQREAFAEASSKIARLRRERGPGTHRRRWQTVRWFMELWWLAGVFGANPENEDPEPDDLVKPDHQKGSHWFAHNAYRTLVVGAVELMGDAASDTDRDRAADRYDAAYPYVHAIAHPVLERLPTVRRAVSELWSDHEHGERATVTRARRMDTFPLFITAWNRSGVLGRPGIPVDHSTIELFEEIIPKTTPWEDGPSEVRT